MEGSERPRLMMRDDGWRVRYHTTGRGRSMCLILQFKLNENVRKRTIELPPGVEMGGQLECEGEFVRVHVLVLLALFRQGQ